MENIADWSKNQANSNIIAYNIVTRSLPEEHFCILSRQTYWGNQPKAVRDTWRLLAYLAIFGAKRSQVMLGNNPASASKEILASQGISIPVVKANLSTVDPKIE